MSIADGRGLPQSGTILYLLEHELRQINPSKIGPDLFPALVTRPDSACPGLVVESRYVRPGDQEFPIPRTVPAVISVNGKFSTFASPEKLFEFLYATHPPQYPGCLPEDQYWAITNYLLVQNHRLSPNQTLGAAGQASRLQDIRRFTAAGALLLLAVSIVAWLVRRRKSMQTGQKDLQPY